MVVCLAGHVTDALVEVTEAQNSFSVVRSAQLDILPRQRGSGVERELCGKAVFKLSCFALPDHLFICCSREHWFSVSVFLTSM